MEVLALLFLVGLIVWASVELIQNIYTFFSHSPQPELPKQERVDYSTLINGIGEGINGLGNEPVCHESAGQCAGHVVELIAHFFHH